MIRLENKNCNTTLTEKQQRYQHYHLKKVMNINILEANKYCFLMKDKKYNKLSLHFLLQEKQVDAIKSLDISGKKDELKQIENIFSKNLMNDLIGAKLKKIVELKDII